MQNDVGNYILDVKFIDCDKAFHVQEKDTKLYNSINMFVFFQNYQTMTYKYM